MDRARESVRETVRDTRHLIMADGNTGSNRLLAVLIVIVGLIVIANLIVTSVILNKPSSPSINLSPTINSIANPLAEILKKTIHFPGVPDNTGNATARRKRSTYGYSEPLLYSQSTAVGKKIYTIAYGHDFGAYEYVDNNGFHQGFFRELVNEVCSAAHVDCRMVYDEYDNCWKSRPGQQGVGGEGLLGHWYDACIGWAPTVERVHVFDFSTSFTNEMKGYFFVKPGKLFDTKDFTGKKIGFISGWADNEHCITRNSKASGKDLTQKQIAYFNDPQELAQAIIDGEVDAGFASSTALEPLALKKTLTMIESEPLSCTMGGLAMMARKDNPFLSWWNEGFQTIRSNGHFRKFCELMNEDHGMKGPIDCHTFK